MKNPWEHLKTEAPYFLDSDIDTIKAYNKTAKEIHVLQETIIPEPYLGSPEAQVVLLNLNPGFAGIDAHRKSDNSEFKHAAFSNLNHTRSDYPFFLLDPKFKNTPGGLWWRKKLRVPLELAGEQILANNLQCIEWFPYSSEKFKRLPKRMILKSQTYSFHLVKEAMRENKLIIVMRSLSAWLETIPELKDYHNYVCLKNPQNTAISPGNMPEQAWEQLTELICQP